MMPHRNLQIAVIGDEDLVNGLRLVGVTRYTVVRDDETAADEIRKALTGLMSDAGIGIIAIQEEYVQHVPDLLRKIKESKDLTPIVIEVPSKHGTGYDNVNEYYKAYVREFTGFDVEI